MLTISPIAGLFEPTPVKADSGGGDSFAPLIAGLLGGDVTTPAGKPLPPVGETLPTLPLTTPGDAPMGPDILIADGLPVAPDAALPAASPALAAPPPSRFAVLPPPTTPPAVPVRSDEGLPVTGDGDAMPPHTAAGGHLTALLATAAALASPARIAPASTDAAAPDVPPPPSRPTPPDVVGRTVAPGRKTPAAKGSAAGVPEDEPPSGPTPSATDATDAGPTIVAVIFPPSIGGHQPASPPLVVADAPLAPVDASVAPNPTAPVRAAAPSLAPIVDRRTQDSARRSAPEAPDAGNPPLARESTPTPVTPARDAGAPVTIPTPVAIDPAQPTTIATQVLPNAASRASVALAEDTPPPLAPAVAAVAPIARPVTTAPVLPRSIVPDQLDSMPPPQAASMLRPAATTRVAAPLPAVATPEVVPAARLRSGDRPSPPPATIAGPMTSLTTPPVAAQPMVGIRPVLASPAPSTPIDGMPAAGAAPHPVEGSQAVPAPLPASIAMDAAPAPVVVASPPRSAVEPSETARVDVPITAAAVAATPAAAPIIQPALQAFGAAMRQALADERKAIRKDGQIEPLAAGVAPAAVPAAAPPVAAADTTLDTADRRWPHAMAAQIEQLRDAADSQSTRIRLLPDVLGPVDVSVRRDGDQVHVHFTAQQAETRQLIADAQPRLADAAEARGLRLGRTDVSGGGDMTGSDRQQQRPAAQNAQPSRPTPARIRATEVDEADSRLA